MGLSIKLPLIREIANAWKSFYSILKNISPNHMTVSLCMKSMAHFTFEFLVMGFSFCHKILLHFCLGSEQIQLVLGSRASAVLFTGVLC